jgi:hypothetical protein
MQERVMTVLQADEVEMAQVLVNREEEEKLETVQQRVQITEQ